MFSMQRISLIVLTLTTSCSTLSSNGPAPQRTDVSSQLHTSDITTGTKEAPKHAANASQSKSNATAAKPKISLLEKWTSMLPGKDGEDALDDEAVAGALNAGSSGNPLSLQANPASSTAAASQGLETLTAALKDVKGSRTPNTAASRKETMKSMENTVMNLLLGKSAFGATPMGGSVKKIVNILTHEMKPKVKDAHKADQRQLYQLMNELKKCFAVRNRAIKAAQPWNMKYKKQSKLHKECRLDEAVKFSSKEACLKQQYALYQVKVLKCKYFATLSGRFGSTFRNRAIVTKAGSESVQSYIGRISGTVCGKHEHGEKGRKSLPGGWGGGLPGGMYDQYLRAKFACNVATKNYNTKVKECKAKIHLYNVRKGKCNQFQTLMDSRSCKHAVLMKDTCEQYAGCYWSRLKAFKIARAKVKMEERDRKAEWRGLTRISCLIGAFGDGSVTDKEVDACKSMTVSTDLLIIRYPRVPRMTKCVVTKLYPSTGAYKRKEFGPLPTLAKGKQSVPCSGVEEIPTKPRKGSPKSCKCRRVTLEGHYRAGPLVKCTKCLDIRRSKDKSSCPRGTKLFAPSSKNDWRTLLASTGPLAHPHWIVDITRPQNGCGGCTSNAMNSRNMNQRSWRTSDGSPWWLRSSKYRQPSGDYSANCFLNLGKLKPANANSVTFDDKGCNYHSKSYYCQKIRIYLKPKKGSPASCKCQPVTLSSRYSAGMLVKCEECLDVRRSTQKNSCPKGMKIFSPRSRADWRTFLVSAQPLRAPNFIIDITRPQNGCGGCTRYPMNSKVPNQATWRTSDGSPWWLRSTRYSQPNGPKERPFGDAGPNGDYTANCFLDLWRRAPNENAIQFNDRKCTYHSRSYYCQPRKGKPSPKPRPPPPPPRRLVRNSRLGRGIKEEVFYFKQGRRVPNLKRRAPSMFRVTKMPAYRSMTRKWRGYARANHFAVRWSGFLRFPRNVVCRFSLRSDDGSNLYINNKKIINNDGEHSAQTRFGRAKLVRGQNRLRIEYFQKNGTSAFMFKWKPPRFKRFRYVPAKLLRYVKTGGFREQVFKIKPGSKRIPYLNRRRPRVERRKRLIRYGNTKGAWKGFRLKDNFAVRWSGILKIGRGGTYRFQLVSDDGSRMFLGPRLKINNDGLHGMRKRRSTMKLRSRRYPVMVEYFEKGGAAGCLFRYMGPDTRNKMLYVGQKRGSIRTMMRSPKTPPKRLWRPPRRRRRAIRRGGRRTRRFRRRFPRRRRGPFRRPRRRRMFR